MAELDYFCGRFGRFVVGVFDLCDGGCEWCDPMHDDDALDRAFGLYTGTNVEVGSLAPATLATIGDAVSR